RTRTPRAGTAPARPGPAPRRGAAAPARPLGGRGRRRAGHQHRQREVPGRAGTRPPALAALGRTGRMTTGHAPHEAPQDERWLAHLREVSDGVVPPTAVDPHALSRVAVRRTRLRRTALATGGGLATVAAVAATAFALSTPAMGTLLPGAAPVAASAPADGTDPARGLVTDLPDGWHAHDLEGLSYALPPD